MLEVKVNTRYLVYDRCSKSGVHLGPPCNSALGLWSIPITVLLDFASKSWITVLNIPCWVHFIFHLSAFSHQKRSTGQWHTGPPWNTCVCVCVCVCVCLRVWVTQLCLTLWDPKDCSPPGCSVCGILQARTLEWVAIPFSRGSSQVRDLTQISRIAGRFFTIWATRDDTQNTRKWII